MEQKQEVTMHMVGHGHIDPVWLWRWTEGYEEARATFRSALDRMKETPEFKFTSSSACFYAWIKACDPAMFSEIQDRVKEGRWELAGGWWVEPDCNTPSGESFVRHGLYSQRFFEQEFGTRAKVGFNPDSFGHAGTLPQILAKQGLDYYVYMRPNAGHGEKAYPGGTTFRWRSKDGSSVTACNLQFSYCSGGELPECVLCLPGNPHLNPGHEHILGFFGVGNHGGGPTKRAIADLLAWMKAKKRPRVRFSTLLGYFEALTDSDAARQLPVIDTDLQYHARGCYSVHSEIKRLNREAEHALMTAERFAAATWLFMGHSYPHASLEQAWKHVLFNQFHDTLGGTCIESAYDDARHQLGAALSAAHEIRNESVQVLARELDTSAAGNTLVAFNPLPWPVTQTLAVPPVVQRVEQTYYRIHAPERPPLHVVDSDGKAVACQEVEGPYPGSTGYAITAQVPAMGYRCYHFRVGAKRVASRRTLIADQTTLENDWWRIEFDPREGHLSRLFDKRARVEVLRKGGILSVLSDSSDTWSHGVNGYRVELGRFNDPVFDLVECGAVCATVRVRTSFGRSMAEQFVTLSRETPAIDVRLRVNWQERYATLKLAYDTCIESGAVTCDTAYGYEERPADGTEQPCQKWVDLSGAIARKAYGLSVLNDGKYGFDARRGVIRMTVLRSPAYAHHDPDLYDPRSQATIIDQGWQRTAVRLLPHDGDWRTAGTARQAWELNEPVFAHVESAHKGKLPCSASLLTADAPNVVLSVLKRAEDGHAVVIRGYETAGRKTTTSITLPAWDCSYETAFAPHEIKTVLFDPREERFTETNLLEEETATARPRRSPKKR